MCFLQDHKKCTVSVSGGFFSQKEHKLESFLTNLCRKEFVGLVAIFPISNLNWKFLNFLLFENA